jgi:hypothetical protein
MKTDRPEIGRIITTFCEQDQAWISMKLYEIDGETLLGYQLDRKGEPMLGSYHAGAKNGLRNWRYSEGHTGSGRDSLNVPINNLTNKNRMAKFAQRLMDKDTKTLMKAGYLTKDLSLTEEGQEALWSLVYETHKDAFVASAKEELEEQKDNQ